MRTVDDIETAGDFFNADEFLAVHADDVRFVAETGEWLVWNGAWWEVDRLGRALEMARQTIDDLRGWVSDADGTDEYRRRAKHYVWSCAAPRRKALLDVASTRKHVAVSLSDLDRRRDLLACPNGTIDLTNGDVYEPQRDHLITRGVRVEYAPGLRSSVWDGFLSTIFEGDDELINYVRRLFGYGITGEVGEHVLPILWGEGGNGKSTLVEAVHHVVGEHATTAADGLLVEQRQGEPHPERVAELRGRRLVVASELENHTALAEALVKKLTGGDRISARYMHGKRFEFEPTHKIFLMTNHMPRVRGTDRAIWRRLRMVPFTVKIPEGDRIPDFSRLLGELHGEAILAWLVSGAIDYYAKGLGTATKVERATLEYREREDVFGQWMAECTMPLAGRHTRVKTLRDSWRTWCEAAGRRPGRDQDFVDWLGQHGIEVDRGRTSLARGLVLKAQTDVEQDECTPAHPSEQIFSNHAYEEDLHPGVLRGATTMVVAS